MRPATFALAAAALTAPLSLNAQSLDLPPRRAGLWEMTSTTVKPKATTMPMKMCADPETDKELMEYGLSLAGTCKSVTKREGSTFVIDAECTSKEQTAKSRTVITGDLQSAYTVRSEGTIGGGGKPPQPTLATITAAWKSAECPGMKPGDVALFGGVVRLNIKQIKTLTKLIR
jgi:hypothetical protein